MLPQLDHENREDTEKYMQYMKTREENYSLLKLQELFFATEEGKRLGNVAGIQRSEKRNSRDRAGSCKSSKSEKSDKIMSLKN